MTSAFEEFEKAKVQDPTQQPKPDAPHLPAPDSPTMIPEVSAPDSPIYEEKPPEIRKNTNPLPPDPQPATQPPSPPPASRPTTSFANLLPLALALLLGFLLGYILRPTSYPGAQPLHPPKTVVKYKTREVVKWKTRWKTKKVVEIREVSDTKLLLQLKKENMELRSKLDSLDKHLELHKMAIRKFFKDPKRYKLGVRTRWSTE